MTRATKDKSALALLERTLKAEARVAELEALINTPQAGEFFEAVRIEAAHQTERWGSQHDAGKEAQDWFWLLGYLGGKALAAIMKGDAEKALHHTVSSAAVLFNWHAAVLKDSHPSRSELDVNTKPSGELAPVGSVEHLDGMGELTTHPGREPQMNERLQELAATIRAGIDAHRYLPDDGQVTASERALLQQGSEARNEAKGALRELVELAGAAERSE